MPATVTVTSGDFRNNLADHLNRAQYDGERTQITRNGRPIAAVICIEDLQLLLALEDRVDGEGADSALREAEETGLIRWDHVR